jgi:hypothetical protein
MGLGMQLWKVAHRSMKDIGRMVLCMAKVDLQIKWVTMRVNFKQIRGKATEYISLRMEIFTKVIGLMDLRVVLAKCTQLRMTGFMKVNSKITIGMAMER